MVFLIRMNLHCQGWARLLIVSMCLVVCLQCFLQTTNTIVNCTTIDSNAYKTINKYLKEKLAKSPKLSLEDLMQSAYKWLHADRKREHVKSIVKFRKHEKSPGDDTLERALHQFTGLKKILKESKCNSESQVIREANNDLIDNEDSNNLELVKKIILNYDKRHSLACQREYPKVFDKKIVSFDMIKRKRIEIVLNQVVRGYLLDEDDKISYLSINEGKDDSYLMDQLKKNKIRTRLYLKFIIGVEGMRPSSGNDSHLLYNGIKSLLATDYGKDPKAVHVKKTKRGNIYMSKEVAIELFKVFLIEPCNSFVEHFSTDLFVPARYDAIRLLKQERQLFQLSDANLSRFYLSWAEFRLCYSFSKDRDYRNKMARKIGEIAEQESRNCAEGV